LSSLELNHLSRQLFLGNEEYINETRKALTSDGGDEQFTYSIENHQFSWKKVDVETDIRVKYGFVHLMNVPVFEAFENMIDILLDRNQFLQQQVKNLENLKDSMEKDTNIYTAKTQGRGMTGNQGGKPSGIPKEQWLAHFYKPREGSLLFGNLLKENIFTAQVQPTRGSRYTVVQPTSEPSDATMYRSSLTSTSSS
ncbi:unnamed protein product, partial [Timema podura]|nr:unnamed protein product [Timema podura]